MAPPATPQEPGCCPDVYLCQGETECPRHSGFTVCCDQPERHVQVYTREEWHRLMWDYEQDLLNEHIKVHKAREFVCAVFGVPSDLIFPRPRPEYITALN